MIPAMLFLMLLVGMFSSDPPASIEGTATCAPGAAGEDIVVFLTGSAIKAPQPPRDPLVIDQRHLRFTPRVLPIVVGTTVAFPNNDPVYHNVFSSSEARRFNLGTFPPGATRKVAFDRPGVVTILCNVHPEMLAYVVVLETPYYTRTDKKGGFRIANVPPGSYLLHFWCEHGGFESQRIALAPGQTRTVQIVLHAGRR
ncbi:MAG: carboxypeptidase regulatory-like domain-containing protein [Acidobacteria bacterium]|nr:carboxypeptidase regulatory-like domain-containing protein [Acidobacteriota bacterium]